MLRQISTGAVLALAVLGNYGFAGEPNATGGTNQVTNSIGMKLTLVLAGEFKMGSGESAKATAAFFNEYDGRTADVFKDEHPQHRVRITNPFYLGTCHVTRGQFRQFVKDSGYNTAVEKGDVPCPSGSREKSLIAGRGADDFQRVGVESEAVGSSVCR